MIKTSLFLHERPDAISFTFKQLFFLSFSMFYTRNFSILQVIHGRLRAGNVVLVKQPNQLYVAKLIGIGPSDDDNLSDTDVSILTKSYTYVFVFVSAKNSLINIISGSFHRVLN